MAKRGKTWHWASRAQAGVDEHDGVDTTDDTEFASDPFDDEQHQDHGQRAPGIAAAMAQARRVRDHPERDRRVRTGRLAGGPRRIAGDEDAG